jgi:C1A family cysteine protease
MVAQDILHLKSVLAAGFPFTFGILIYPSFENATDGLIPLPRAPEQCLGGHDLISYGFKDDPSWAGGGYFQGQNSWGSNWGIAGRFQIPYAYLTNASLAFQMTTGTGVKV